MDTKRWMPLVLIAVVSGCGGGGSSASNTSPTSPTTPTTPTSGNVAATISITDYYFTPASVAVKVGSTVRWVNNGAVSHTTVSDKTAWTSAQLSGSTTDQYGGQSGGQSYDYTFGTTGTYSYHCSIHPPTQYSSFVGTITITP